MTNTSSMYLETQDFCKSELLEKTDQSPSLLTGSKSPSNTCSPVLSPKKMQKQNQEISLSSQNNNLMVKNQIPESKTTTRPQKKSKNFENSLEKGKKENSLLSQKRKRKKEKYNFQKTSSSPSGKKAQINANLLILQKKVCLLYPEEEYNKDLLEIKQNKQHQFMLNNFPSMYNHFNFYTYHKCLEKRRNNNKEIFIVNNQMNQNFFLNKDYMNNEIKVPKNIWSVPEKEVNYEEFYNKCIQVWPFNECRFVKEFALEFLMNNNYDIDACLNNLDQFVNFVQQKAKEHNIPIVRTDARIIKNYSLRAQKKP